ncbi:hypothetical protein O181_040407 [Austropuccinia psidii MF-1]|uniref:Integrase catalytic domain-containing protein n=1 Tax=Austropuccinia psidii MF-1 TaxID=1389203 RepID=A0A9Q3DER8_9BASI|nr:hypothetical protein [Austropuccinia psidii MF-1]
MFSKTPIFLAGHKDDTSMDTALLVWNRLVSWTGILTSFISYSNPKFTSALWKNLYQLFGTKSSFYTDYHPQTYGLAEKIIQTFEDMVRRFCPYSLELEECFIFTHHCCTLPPALELEYKTSVHASTNLTNAIIEKACNPRLPQDVVEIHPKTSSFKIMLEKSRKHAVR